MGSCKFCAPLPHRDAARPRNRPSCAAIDILIRVPVSHTAAGERPCAGSAHTKELRHFGRVSAHTRLIALLAQLPDPLRLAREVQLNRFSPPRSSRPRALRRFACAGAGRAVDGPFGHAGARCEPAYCLPPDQVIGEDQSSARSIVIDARMASSSARSDSVVCGVYDASMTSAARSRSTM